MAQPLHDTLVEIMRKLRADSPDIIGAAVGTTDGLTIAYELPESVDEQGATAAAASMLIHGQRAASNLKHGEVERLFMESSEGQAIVARAGPNAVLVVVVRKDAKLGLIFGLVRRATKAIRAAMSARYSES